jgi:hypothetical protein
VVAVEGSRHRAEFRPRPVVEGNLLKTGIPRDADVERITLHGVDGRSVFRSRTPVDAIDLSGLPAGIYWLKVESPGSIGSRAGTLGYTRVTWRP